MKPEVAAWHHGEPGAGSRRLESLSARPGAKAALAAAWRCWPWPVLVCRQDRGERRAARIAGGDKAICEAGLEGWRARGGHEPDPGSQASTLPSWTSVDTPRSRSAPLSRSFNLDWSACPCRPARGRGEGAALQPPPGHPDGGKEPGRSSSQPGRGVRCSPGYVASACLSLVNYHHP